MRNFTHRPDSFETSLRLQMLGVTMLIALSICASFVAGFVRAPWWFWIVGGATLALLAATDPQRLRVSYADMRGLSSLPLVLDDMKIIARECLVSAAAFGVGTALSYWALS